MCAVAAAGLMLTAYGMQQQAQGQKNLANYNAQVADGNAKMAEYSAQDAIRRGDEEAAAIRRNADMLKGSQRASMAARGLDLTQGTAQELQDQTDFFAQTDMATARNNAQREAWAARVHGANFASEAAMQRATARSISPGLAFGTSLLGGAGQVADKWYQNKARNVAAGTGNHGFW
jgi:hypothetical protein